MGKGGTKFVGEAIAHRKGRARSTYSSKELKKNMEKFLETGVHPELVRASQQAASGVLVALPDPDAQRPHVFFDITIDNSPVGRLVVELFEDLAPAAARHLMNRCLSGATASLHGASFHKILPHYAVHMGKSVAAAFPGSAQVPPNSRLQHNARGAVSVSRDGTEACISMGRSLVLDNTHQVVGIVRHGMDILDLLDDVPRSPDDAPMLRVRVAKCGATNAQGTHEALADALAKETPQQAAERLKQQSADTRDAVMEALQQGMGRKRAADEAEAGPSSAAAAAAAAAGGVGGSGPRASAAGGAAAPPACTKKRRVLDSLLDDLDSDSSSGGGSSDSGEDDCDDKGKVGEGGEGDSDS